MKYVIRDRKPQKVEPTVEVWTIITDDGIVVKAKRLDIRDAFEWDIVFIKLEGGLRRCDGLTDEVGFKLEEYGNCIKLDK